jgi:glycolate oxidase FAD binding subunit
VTATCFLDGRLFVRLSGGALAVDAATARLGGVPVEADSAFWRSIRDHTHEFFRIAQESEGPLWRLSIKSTAPHADLGGEQLIEWGGALRWLRAGDRTDPVGLRAWAREHGGHATLFRGEDKSTGVFDPLAAPLLAIHQRLKNEFDPHGILNPGRLYVDL